MAYQSCHNIVIYLGKYLEVLHFYFLVLQIHKIMVEKDNINEQ